MPACHGHRLQSVPAGLARGRAGEGLVLLFDVLISLFPLLPLPAFPLPLAPPSSVPRNLAHWPPNPGSPLLGCNSHPLELLPHPVRTLFSASCYLMGTLWQIIPIKMWMTKKRVDSNSYRGSFYLKNFIEIVYVHCRKIRNYR